MKLAAGAAEEESADSTQFVERKASLGSPYTLRDILNTLFHERRLIVLTFLCVVGLGLLFALFAGETYTAESRLLIIPNLDYVPDVGAKTPAFAINDKQFVASEIEFLKNPLLYAKAIEAVGLERIYPALAKRGSGQLRDELSGAWHSLGSLVPRIGVSPQLSKEKLEAIARQQRVGLAIEEIKSKLKILPVLDSNVILLTFVHKDPVVAADFLNALVAAYVEHRHAVFSQPRAAVFAEQRDKYAARLAEVEKKLEDFKLNKNISAFPDQKSLLVRQLAEEQNNRVETATRLTQAKSREQGFEQALKKVPEAVPQYSENANLDAMDTARASEVTLRMRRAEMLTKFQANSRFVTDIDEQLAALHKHIESAPPKKSDTQRQGRNAVFENISLEAVRAKVEVSALAARLDQAEQTIKTIQHQLQYFDLAEREYNGLMLERGMLENNLKIYAQKVEEALIMEEFDRQKSSNLRVIQEATPPPKSNDPLPLILAVSLVLGLVIALIFARLVDFFREVMISPESAQRALGLPVLIAIPDKPAIAGENPNPSVGTAGKSFVRRATDKVKTLFSRSN